MEEVTVRPVDLQRLAAALPPERGAQLLREAERARAAFGDRTVWHVNATARGGGVAEMLQTLLAYATGARIDNRWVVMDADPAFFTVTKRLHNMLHGAVGDGGTLGVPERDHYDQVMRANLEQLLQRVSPEDLVVLHDPQTVGMAAALRAAVAGVVWRCHVGRDEPNDITTAAWEFLRPYVQHCHAVVFSRREYAPDWIDPSRLHVIPPSIDPLAVKNQPLSDRHVAAILARVGLVAGGPADADAEYTRSDGSPGAVRPRRGPGGLLVGGEPPPHGAPLVVQVSRWDRLKDMPGVMTGFARGVDHGLLGRAHLVLAGPEVTGVSDDPEGAAVLAGCREVWSRLPDAVRRRVHLVVVPMDDRDENAVIVNALQRHATVVVQKSLAEGFGLTVTEAMWKGRAVVASRVGGIQDQITDGRDGLLLQDPSDPDEFAAAVDRVVGDPALARRLGTAARERVVEQYLTDRHLTQYVDLLSGLAGARSSQAGLAALRAPFHDG